MITNTIKGDMISIMKNCIEHEYPMLFTHGCNCFAAMRSGIAATLAETFPIIEQMDLATFEYYRDNNKRLLGNIEEVPLSPEVKLINSYTQYYPGRDLRINALKSCFEKINSIYVGQKLIIPKIGAGVAGGDWEEITKVINSVTPDIDIVVVEWQKC